VVVDGTSTKVPVKPSGTAQDVVKTGTVMVPTMTLVALTIHVACSVELEQSVITVVRVEVVGMTGAGGFEDGITGAGGLEDGMTGAGGFEDGTTGAGGLEDGMTGAGGFEEGTTGAGGFEDGGIADGVGVGQTKSAISQLVTVKVLDAPFKPILKSVG
jgi:hypothetical protein